MGTTLLLSRDARSYSSSLFLLSSRRPPDAVIWSSPATYDIFIACLPITTSTHHTSLARSRSLALSSALERTRSVTSHVALLAVFRDGDLGVPLGALVVLVAARVVVGEGADVGDVGPAVAVVLGRGPARLAALLGAVGRRVADLDRGIGNVDVDAADVVDKGRGVALAAAARGARLVRRRRRRRGGAGRGG
ncbi:hypothetical protein PG993_014849 [Apiospora rasikravindrae]|uniref:Uncharacterized protein n=1 Tax=Apiospora rasikravindrae TaxID=990691 RepID=A0ABR1RNZ5_9PEZI